MNSASASSLHSRMVSHFISMMRFPSSIAMANFTLPLVFEPSILPTGSCAIFSPRADALSAAAIFLAWARNTLIGDRDVVIDLHERSLHARLRLRELTMHRAHRGKHGKAHKVHLIRRV